MTVFGCSDDKASSAKQAPTSKAETMAASEPTMEVPPWASLEQEVIYYSDE